MGVFYKIADLMARQHTRFNTVMGSAGDKWRALVDMSLKDAKSLTAGEILQKILTVLGNPFARIGVTTKSPQGRMRGARAVGRAAVSRMLGRGTVPRLPVNKQSERLHRSMRVLQMPNIGGDISGAVGPDASAGKSVNALIRGGTFKSGKHKGGVVDRGFWQEIERRFNARKKAFLDDLRRMNGAP